MESRWVCARAWRGTKAELERASRPGRDMETRSGSTLFVSSDLSPPEPDLEEQVMAPGERAAHAKSCRAECGPHESDRFASLSDLIARPTKFPARRRSGQRAWMHRGLVEATWPEVGARRPLRPRPLAPRGPASGGRVSGRGCQMAPVGAARRPSGHARRLGANRPVRTFSALAAAIDPRGRRAGREPRTRQGARKTQSASTCDRQISAHSLDCNSPA